MKASVNLTIPIFCWLGGTKFKKVWHGPIEGGARKKYILKLNPYID